jgi:hypothetical protein
LDIGYFLLDIFELFLDKYRFYRALVGGAHRAVLVGADNFGLAHFVKLERVRTNFGTAAAADAFILVDFDGHKLID